MAEVLGKASLFPTCSYSQEKNLEGGACLIPKKISGFCLKKNNFSSLKLKSLASRSDFNCQRVVFLEKKNMNKRRFSQVPIKAQLVLSLLFPPHKHPIFNRRSSYLVQAGIQHFLCCGSESVGSALN